VKSSPLDDFNADGVVPGPTTTTFYVEEPGTATVLTLGAHMCKWPIGDPAMEGFSFCGRRTDVVGPYCNFHAAGAYQNQQIRKHSSASEMVRSLRRYL
jgi:GcrA cell cycle regulator